MTHPIVEERVAFPVAQTHCEGVLAYPETGEPKSNMLLLSPHPLLGGDMANNVIRHIARRAAEEGDVTLRFNYRGVGQSPLSPAVTESSFEYFNRMEKTRDYARLLPDVLAALDFFRGLISDDTPLTIVGYSLGAVLAGMLRDLPVTTRLVCISAPNRKVSLATFRESPYPKGFITGGNDTFCDSAALEREMKDFLACTGLRTIPDADHFFRGQEKEVYALITKVTLGETR